MTSESCIEFQEMHSRSIWNSWACSWKDMTIGKQKNGLDESSFQYLDFVLYPLVISSTFLYLLCPQGTLSNNGLSLFFIIFILLRDIFVAPSWTSWSWFMSCPFILVWLLKETHSKIDGHQVFSILSLGNSTCYVSHFVAVFLGVLFWSYYYSCLHVFSIVFQGNPQPAREE